MGQACIKITHLFSVYVCLYLYASFYFTISLHVSDFKGDQILNFEDAFNIITSVIIIPEYSQ